MSETNRAKREANRASTPSVRWSWGLVLAGLVFALAMGFGVGVEMSSWRQMKRLREDFAAANLESFFLGVHLRESVGRMNAALLRFQLSDDDAERANFHREVGDLSNRLARTTALLTTEAERELVEAIAVGFAAYRVETAGYLERGIRGIRKDTAFLLHRQLAAKSAPLVALADRLVEAQQAAMQRFLGSAQGALESMQRLLILSLGLMVVLIGSVAALFQRIQVAPLQARLSASEALIQRQEKLASLGVLAAGVAHEVRNPLTAIKFRLFSLRRALPAGFSDHEDLTVVDGEIHRLERIVRDFLQFARPSEPALANLPVAPFLGEVRDLLRPELQKRSVELTVETTPALVVRADPQQLRQVLINLIQNAAESLDRPGTIFLRARGGSSSSWPPEGRVVTIDVQDNGPGMSADIERRLFDPFFSTKEGGTGLGLPIAARIVEKHGGFLHYLTRPGQGTTFSIVLPEANEHAS
jgi:signal transduction histidine kinase